jgi:hypothetical protein
MLRCKSKMLFLKQKRNTQNIIALLNYLKRIGPQQLMLRTQVFPKKFSNANTTTTTLLKKFFCQENSCSGGI